MTPVRIGRRCRWVARPLFAAGLGVLVGGLVTAPARAEQRLYLLRVTQADGHRYETLSSEGPFTYASLVGGTIHVSRDYGRVWSPQVKVAVVDTWIEHRVPLRAHWTSILRERGLFAVRNHKLLQRRRPLSPVNMREPEAVARPQPPGRGTKP